MTSPSIPPDSGSLLVQIASYNTNLQGTQGTPQDLVDWLSPTLSASHTRTPPDIVAVGFQELLPLHLGLTGLSQSVIATRDELLRSQIEKHNSVNGEQVSYMLVAKAVNVGVALLVYARDHGVGQRICDVQTAWTGFGPGWMGNKCAVGVRFRVSADVNGEGGEVMTFVCTHMTAHAHNLRSRLSDWGHIVKTLLFSGRSIYSTSHLFVFGDLNFRLDAPSVDGQAISRDSLVGQLATPEGRDQAREWDQLRRELKAGNVLHGLREGDFWDFPPSYKYILGEKHAYSKRRNPAWTDRILFTTYLDSPSTPDVSYITPLLYTSVQSYTTSDHKPIVALLRVPSASSSTLTPMLYHHDDPPFKPSSRVAMVKKCIGKVLGWIVGWLWCMLWFIGVGHAGVGLGNFVLGAGAAAWWRSGNA
ncbi:hypothetical protein FRC08_018883 [Ceratobasidium sp. 394]|nr:hypothetical protein FRC08_018883 [Ceratobasidium sp. 394]KAG9082774.1 hypothetical protein FS749_006582 [Ceratobasidium sp. UAMH 11750]